MHNLSGSKKSKLQAKFDEDFHDAVVLDFHNDDEHLLPHIIKLMSVTKLGKFKINISEGKNLGSLRKRDF